MDTHHRNSRLDMSLDIDVSEKIVQSIERPVSQSLIGRTRVGLSIKRGIGSVKEKISELKRREGKRRSWAHEENGSEMGRRRRFDEEKGRMVLVKVGKREEKLVEKGASVDLSASAGASADVYGDGESEGSVNADERRASEEAGVEIEMSRITGSDSDVDSDSDSDLDLERRGRPTTARGRRKDDGMGLWIGLETDDSNLTADSDRRSWWDQEIDEYSGSEVEAFEFPWSSTPTRVSGQLFGGREVAEGREDRIEFGMGESFSGFDVVEDAVRSRSTVGEIRSEDEDGDEDRKEDEVSVYENVHESVEYSLLESPAPSQDEGDNEERWKKSIPIYDAVVQTIQVLTPTPTNAHPSPSLPIKQNPRTKLENGNKNEGNHPNDSVMRAATPPSETGTQIHHKLESFPTVAFQSKVWTEPLDGSSDVGFDQNVRPRVLPYTKELDRMRVAKFPREVGRFLATMARVYGHLSPSHQHQHQHQGRRGKIGVDKLELAQFATVLSVSMLLPDIAECELSRRIVQELLALDFETPACHRDKDVWRELSVRCTTLLGEVDSWMVVLERVRVHLFGMAVNVGGKWWEEGDVDRIDKHRRLARRVGDEILRMGALVEVRFGESGRGLHGGVDAEDTVEKEKELCAKCRAERDGAGAGEEEKDERFTDEALRLVLKALRKDEGDIV